MDRENVNVVLTGLLNAHRLERYQGLVLALESESDLDQLVIQVEAVCLDHNVWRRPDVNGAPTIPCTRRDWMRSVFTLRPNGLVIVKPTEWMIDWSELDETTFWNALADAFGRHEIISIAVSTPALIKHLRISFVPYKLSGLTVSIWVSRHQPVDHLKEFFE
ncbi:hypothetical protein [Thiocapsa marina]|uniref:Uncharacterized protein n=1 Tax=Thiocapsa marina 5811 TaxID=768671 RepID=F9UI36_9GAMM|nr:hypothetical protein [Thiocapsa marina]EGV16212.1 hypothetical protein ThimaDRAFT_4589 [Thiocapsa marina 5811]